MKEVELLKKVLDVFEFKTITDEFGNEYVLYKSNEIEMVSGIFDKTEFEASENHIHIVDNISKKEYGSLCLIANQMGALLLSVLRYSYPKKKFMVFVSVQLNESLIIRFHQKWENEQPFYDVNVYNDMSNERIYVFE